ncbi:MAG TPA: hypothetical protein VJB87_04445 [Candidatus Nanoarchaeia archaeon]|nr:hypothetical protein [Candidatus Nanoarchaeia archaeon]
MSAVITGVTKAVLDSRPDLTAYVGCASNQNHVLQVPVGPPDRMNGLAIDMPINVGLYRVLASPPGKQFVFAVGIQGDHPAVLSEIVRGHEKELMRRHVPIVLSSCDWWNVFDSACYFGRLVVGEQCVRPERWPNPMNPEGDLLHPL